MEQVLEVCKRPYNEDNQVVCMDESPHQLIEDVHTTDIEPGKEERADYEYIRHGVVNIFMANEPLRGRRIVEITERKTKEDWAEFIRIPAGEVYPQAKKITLIMDNFKTHTIMRFL